MTAGAAKRGALGSRNGRKPRHLKALVLGYTRKYLKKKRMIVTRPTRLSKRRASQRLTQN